MKQYPGFYEPVSLQEVFEGGYAIIEPPCYQYSKVPDSWCKPNPNKIVMYLNQGYYLTDVFETLEECVWWLVEHNIADTTIYDITNATYFRLKDVRMSPPITVTEMT